MRTYHRLSARAALVSGLVDAWRPSVADLDHDGIQRERAAAWPTTGVLGGVFARVVGRAAPDVGITYGTAPARDEHEIPLRMYRPRALRDSRTDVPVVMWFHGGGWVLGNLVNEDQLCTVLAREVGCVVVSVDYRMAPEHRAPTAALDCVDATTWVQVNGDVLRADTTRMAVAGHSAGGNLAAVVAQVLRDHGVTALRHQALVYPATDLTLASPSVEEHANAPLLTRRSIDAFLSHYVAPGRDVRDPLLSPLHGSLEGLPPALVQVADVDPVRDDGLRYAAALRAAGVPTRVTNYLRMPHGFASMPGVAPALVRQQRWELVTELSAALAAS